MTGASDWERGVTLQQLEHDILDRPTASAGKAIGDVVVACARIAHKCGLDFQEIVRAKFNEVSDRVGSAVRL